MDEACHLRDLALALLSRVGRHSRHLDGLRQAHGAAPVLAGTNNPLAGRMRRLRGTDSLESERMAAIKTSLPRRRFDVVIVGAGGSGMRASLQLARAGLSVAVLSKVFPDP